MSVLAVFFLAAATSAGSTVPPEDIYALGQSLARTLCRPETASRVESFRPSTHDAETTERLETVSCGAGEAQILRSSSTTDPTGLVLYLHVHSRTPGLPDFIQIGAPIHSAMTRLGEPFHRQAGSMVFVLDESTSTLEISYVDGKIMHLVWSFYTG